MTTDDRAGAQASEPSLYVGIMSGTSTDGVDAVLARFGDGAPQCLATESVDMPASLRAALLALNVSGDDELHRAAMAGDALARLYATAVERLLASAAVPAKQVRAIGAHGQTVRHRPELGYTLQLNAPSILAELTGIAVVSDFRSRDVAAGGQGAPLVPAFHASVFGSDRRRLIINLGGIANITALMPDGEVRGFDTGPANMLMDAWCALHLNRAYDKDGRWAASGKPIDPLLDCLMNQPWLDLAPPKSTGRDLFNIAWLQDHLAEYEAETGGVCAPEDVQATLCKFTAMTIAQAVRHWVGPVDDAFAAGGGARNPTLMHALSDALGQTVRSTDTLGVPAAALEAFAFAWLAHQHCNGATSNLPAVTGARASRVLGSYTPG